MATAKPEYVFPRAYHFPPFYTPQPNSLTRAAQLRQWSNFIQSYCRHHRIFKLSLIDAIESPLFNNVPLRKRIDIGEAKYIIDYMASKEGDGRAEWTGPDKNFAWIWWRKPEEWADLMATWVDQIGQKGVVLTLYELTEGEASINQEFYGLDSEVLQRSLQILVKRRQASVFGSEDQQGVKFY